MRFRYPLFLTALAIFSFGSLAWPMSQREYGQRARRLRAVGVLTVSELQKVRTKKPSAALEMSGQVSGILVSSNQKTLMVRLDDDQSVEIAAADLPTEVQAGVRVRCLARSRYGAASGPLTLEAIVIDVGRAPVVPRRARYQGGIYGNLVPLPSRGADDVLLRCKRAIAYLNPRLSFQENELIASSIVTYSNYLGVDPYFVVAVVAAESRFNPNARSYKGALGLGQLMPSTARGIGVNPYDPVENLAGAIRILRGHLEKYEGQPYQVALALSSYNAGSGAVAKHGGVPPYRETRNYIWKVYEYYCWMLGVPPEPRPTQ